LQQIEQEVAEHFPLFAPALLVGQRAVRGDLQLADYLGRRPVKTPQVEVALATLEGLRRADRDDELALRAPQTLQEQPGIGIGDRLAARAVISGDSFD